MTETNLTIPRVFFQEMEGNMNIERKGNSTLVQVYWYIETFNFKFPVVETLCVAFMTYLNVQWNKFVFSYIFVYTYSIDCNGFLYYTKI